MALNGIRVIEMAGLAPGPFCGMILSDFGARVIRVDRPNGPPLDVLARGKQSVTVNLKTTEGVNVVKKMCQQGDVIIDPYRPGVMEKLGLGPEVLIRSNPRLIYARLTGFGQEGVLMYESGHDINYIAMSGVLSKFGRKNERPYPPLNIAGDFAGGGALCALGIVLALFERSVSGKGQVVDANMVEGSAYIGSWLDAAKTHLFRGKRGCNMLDGGAAFYDTYETKDGKYMAVGAIEPQFYRNLLKGLGVEKDGHSQRDDQDKQREVFKKLFLRRTRQEWVERFKDLDACVSPVLTPEEAAEHPHNKCKGSFNTQGQNLISGPAPRLSRSKEVREQRPSPEMGEHTLDVLRELGYSEGDIRQLVAGGAIASKARL